MASQTANGDILASILAELRDLKLSHASLEQRLESLAISGSTGSPSRSTTPITGSSSSVQPIAIGSRSPVLGGLSTSAGSPPALSQFTAGSPSSPGGVGNGYQRKASVDYNSIGNAAKQEYLNWTRSNSGTPQGGISASDPNGKSSGGRTEGSDSATKAIYPSRAILTTYPGQVGVTPLPLKWGAATAEERGPILASRQPLSLAKRNAIGAYGGAYSIYHALSVATGALSAAQRPNYTHTEPTFDVLPNPSWFDPSKICVLDPWGHLAQIKFKAQIDAGIDIRPTLSITRAHLKIAELDDAAAKGRFPVDGKIVIPSAAATLAETLTTESADKLDPQATEVLNSIKDSAGVEVNVSKVAFENVWYLPGVADRLGVSEPLLRRCLFEDTGGMYPELLTRPDLKVFLPPIGGGTCYIFGPTQYLSDPSKKLAVRVHDACSGSDIFGSDICTCRPYLLHGIEECIKMAQNGGVGLVVYFQKEGRALGEVTKYLVYNARKRGGDSASTYFARTENIAGVKDMRFQALMPDILHWFGIQKIDDMYSMSDMKHDAIVNSGISIGNRHDLPSDLIPPDSQVEIQAKIQAGYYTSGAQVTAEDLTKTVGRAWEDLEH